MLNARMSSPLTSLFTGKTKKTLFATRTGSVRIIVLTSSSDFWWVRLGTVCTVQCGLCADWHWQWASGKLCYDRKIFGEILIAALNSWARDDQWESGKRFASVFPQLGISHGIPHGIPLTSNWQFWCVWQMSWIMCRWKYRGNAISVQIE